MNCIDVSTLAVSTTANNLTDCSPAMPNNARGAILSPTTGGIVWRADGTAPTNTTGAPVSALGSVSFDSWTAPEKNWSGVLKKIKLLRLATTDSTLTIHWFD